MAKSDRKKYGVRKVPLVGTEILSKPMPHFQDQGIDAHSLLVINREAGTFVSANVYDGCLGKGYDPTEITHPLPADGDEKWKEWKRRGYEAAAPGQTFGGVVVLIGETAEETADELETADEA